jgi:release factor glutamine methyltransferase
LFFVALKKEKVAESKVILSDALNLFQQEIGSFYPENEFKSIRRIVFDRLASVNPVDFHLKPNLELDGSIMEKIQTVCSELKQYRPIQYVLGITSFLGLQLRVTPAVLIPRPETEELADWIIKTHKFNENRILDIGTGSGCLAIALDKLMLHSHTDGIDISNEALEIAEENSYMNESIVNFFHYDIFQGYNGENSDNFKESYDIIVSNPPYVMKSEASSMLPNVLNFEPHLALFVEDNDPLVYYKAISDFARIKLEWGGFLYFEINPLFVKEIQELLMLKGYRNIQVKTDLSGKPRMVRAQIKLFKKGDNPELEKVRQMQ